MAKKKRANREGTISKRKDGRWVARLMVEGKRYHYYGKTRGEVEQKLTAAKRQHHLGLSVSDEAITVGQYLEHWLEHDVRPSVRPSTYTSYKSHVRLYLEPTLGRHRLVKLSPRHVQTMLSDLQAKKGLSASTAASVRATLRRALN